MAAVVVVVVAKHRSIVRLVDIAAAVAVDNIVADTNAK